MTATMTETTTVTRKQSGRKASRTDYVYVLTYMCSNSATEVSVTRTLGGSKRGAIKHSGLGLRELGFKKFLKTWYSEVLPAIGSSDEFYIIQRMPLHG